MLRRLGIFGLIAGALLAGPAAHARVFVGVGFGFPAYGPYYYPRYYYPPVVVAPPPVVVAPPPAAYYPPPVAAAGRTCFAQPYVCPLAVPSPVGSPCSCPTNSGLRELGRTG